MNKIYVFLILLLFLSSCFSTNTRRLERYDIKKMASESTEAANDFLRRYKYDKALEYFKDALNNNIMVDNIPGIIKNYTDIGKVYVLTQNYDLSINYFDKAIELTKEGDYQSEKAYVYNSMGEAYYFLKDYDKSKSYFKKSLKIEVKQKNLESQALIMLNLAKVDRGLGDYEQSLKQLLDSARLFKILYKRRTIENTKNLSLVLYSIGQTYSKLKKYNKAIEYIEEALVIDKKIENPSGIADDYYALGILSERTNDDLDIALKYFLRSRDIYNRLNNNNQYGEISDNIADIYFKKGDLKNYYENKKLFYALSFGENKINAAKDILKMLDHEKISEFFTLDEINKIKKRFNKYQEQ